MNKQILTLVLNLLIVAISLPGVAGSAPATGELAPDFALRNHTGTNLRLSEYRSEVVVLNFWAPWCGKCRSAGEFLNDLYQANHSNGLQVLSVGIDDDLQETKDFVQELGLDYPVMPDNELNSVSKDYGLGRLPVTIILDREGVIRFTHIGFSSENKQQIATEVAALIAE